MFERENFVGFLLLGLCAVIGGVLVWQIVTGNDLEYSGPSWLAWVLGILFFGGIIYALVIGRGRRGRRWPDPRTGGGWRRWFGRDQNDQRF